MIEKIKKFLEDENIFLYGFCPLEHCIINKRYLLDKANINDGFAVIFAIPYYTHACEVKRNISSYAVGRDYHLFVNEFEKRLLPKLTAAFPNTNFAIFADHSPIDERDTAVKAGLGILGKNQLLITPKYSSYVFLSEIIVGAKLPEGYSTDISELKYCEECGLCQKNCPWINGECNECLSAITQKKGNLDDSEKALIKKYGLWGCDICAEVCPHTKKAISEGTIYSPIKFFSENALPFLTYNALNNMSDYEFLQRAYSWRGKKTILRNAEIAEDIDVE